MTNGNGNEASLNGQNTIISLPNVPEEIGILLPPPSLRRLDFSALEFETLRRMLVEYVRTYFPEDFNDFVTSNGTVMFWELVSAVGGVLSERSDILADESFLPTAQSRTAVSQHLELIGQILRRATAAVVDIECSLPTPVNFDVIVPSGLSFSVPGPDGRPVRYELFRAPGDFVSNIIIPRNKRGVIAFAIEGKFGSPVIETSNGEPGQFVDIVEPNVLDSPITVSVESGDNTSKWERIDFLERAGANEEVFQVIHLDDRTRVKFGDNRNGKAPISNQIIKIDYRLGGGIRGRVGRGAINEPRPVAQVRFATQTVTFRNLVPSRGGRDAESLSEAKRRAPRQFSAHGNAATSDDYAILSESFEHPVHGIVSKAIAVLRSGIDNSLDKVIENVRSATSEEDAKNYLLGNYVNRNIVEIYILQEGEKNPVAPGKGLKEALKTHLSDLNVFTDEVRVLDGKLKSVDINATVVLSRNVDPGTVKENVLFAINKLFNISERSMGESFSRSDLVFAIKNVDGVKSVDIFEPVDDFPALRKIKEFVGDARGVAVDELIVLGQQNIQFFMEQGNATV